MATTIGKVKLLYDVQLRTTAAGTVNGAAQAKGTATDLELSILAGPDGATPVAGTSTLLVQGSNVTATATSNWNTVTADKGTIANVTASGTQTLHFAQLQYAFYRLNVVGSSTPVSNISASWAYSPVQDSFDGTVA